MKKLTRDEMKNVIGGMAASIDDGVTCGFWCKDGCGKGCHCPIACTVCAKNA